MLKSPDDFWPQIIIWPSNPIKKLLSKIKYSFWVIKFRLHLIIMRVKMQFDSDEFKLEDMYPKIMITVKFKRPVILWPKNPFWNIVARCRYVFKLLKNKVCSKREEK